MFPNIYSSYIKFMSENLGISLKTSSIAVLQSFVLKLSYEPVNGILTKLGMQNTDQCCFGAQQPVYDT